MREKGTLYVLMGHTKVRSRAEQRCRHMVLEPKAELRSRTERAEELRFC